MYFDQYLVSLGCKIGELMFEMQKILSLYGYEYCNTTQSMQTTTYLQQF